jgi:hypothetical protein
MWLTPVITAWKFAPLTTDLAIKQATVFIGSRDERGNDDFWGLW